MPRNINNMKDIREYMLGVESRAQHHASTVTDILYPLLGVIIRFVDDRTIDVMEQNGEMKNVLWFKINGNRYVLSFNHIDECIECRDKSIRGNVLFTVDNSTHINELVKLFRDL